MCGSKRLARAFSSPTNRGLDSRQWSVSECADCGHQCVNPQPTWDELQFYYNQGYDAYDPDHGSRGSDDLEIQHARQTGSIRHIPLPAGLRLLDVGCGGGWFLRICKELGAIEQGVEPSEYAASLTRKQGLRVFQGTLEEYAEQVPNGTQFDVITASHVIEHVPDPVRTLSTMRHLLAPDGYVWIAVPNAAYPICRALKGKWHSSDLPYHLMHFTPASMVEAGRRAGLKVKDQTTVSWPHHVAESIRTYLRFRWYLPRRLTRRLSFVVDPAARRFAEWADAKVLGEGLLTNFVAD